MRLALGVWATVGATPRTKQKQASKESSVVFIRIDIRWGLLMTVNSVLGNSGRARKLAPAPACRMDTAV